MSIETVVNLRGALLLDREKTVLALDEAAQEIFGRPQTESPAGMPIEALLPHLKDAEWPAPGRSSVWKTQAIGSGLGEWDAVVHITCLTVNTAVQYMATVEKISPERTAPHAVFSAGAPHPPTESEHEAPDSFPETSLLLQASRRFQELFQGLPIACVCYDRTGNIYEWNRAFEGLSELTPEKILQMKIWDFLSDQEDRELSQEWVRRSFDGQKVEIREFDVRLPNGSFRRVMTSTIPLRGDGGEITGNVSANIDITERKAVEEAFKSASEQLNCILETVAEGIIMIDGDQNIMFANAAAEQMLRLKRRESGKYAKLDWNILTLDGRPCPLHDLPDRQVATTGAAVYGKELLMESTDGRRVIFSVNAAPIRNNAGQITGIVESFHDITARKRSEEALRVAHEHLEQRVALRTQELAAANHALQVEISKHRQSAEALQRSNSMMVALQEATPDGIIVINENREIAYGNIRFSEMWRFPFVESGFSADSILEMICESVVESEPLRNASERTRQHPMERQETDITLLDGRIFNRYAAPVLSKEGHFYGRIIRFRDITERKMAEAALRESEARYQRIAANVPGMVYQFIVHSDGKFEFSFVSEGCRDIYGMEPAVIMADPYFLINSIDSEDRPSFERSISEAVQSQQSWQWEGRIVLRSGEIRWIQTASRPELLPNGDTLCDGILMDITPSKEAEQELQRISAQTELILTSISSILIGVDEHDKVMIWNEAARRAFGVSAADAFDKPFAECGIQWDWKVVDAALETCRSRSESLRVDDIRYTRSDGREGIIGVTLNPINTHSGTYNGFLLLATDITERRVMEGQLTQAQKLESIGQLAAGIAHEINTPIQYLGDNMRFLQESFEELNGALEIYDQMLEKAESGPLSAEMIASAKSAVEAADLAYLQEEIPRAISQSLEGVGRVAHIVRAMKEFSHPGSAEKTMLDLNQAIESTITVARNEWKYVAEMVTDFDPSLPLVPCLPGELNQVILNMTVNAAHAISDVVGDGGEKGTITVSTRRVDDWVEVRLSDTGSGIPESIRTKIFDPFFTTKEVGRGTGQGLAISHSVVVDKHGGTISLELEVGQGTTFIIRLPLEVQSAPLAKAA